MIVAWVLMLLLGGSELGYDRVARVSYVNEALRGMRGADRGQLRVFADTLRKLERSACRSQIDRLRQECLISAARRRCKGHGETCAAWADVIVTTLLAEGQLLTPTQRHEVLRRSKAVRTELVEAVRRVQAKLVIEFHLASQGICASHDDDCIAEQIDEFCLQAADEDNLSWQHCAATLVWFVGAGEDL